MSLSIYKFIACYISKGKLAQVVGSNPLGSNKWEDTVASL